MFTASVDERQATTRQRDLLDTLLWERGLQIAEDKVPTTFDRMSALIDKLISEYAAPPAEAAQLEMIAKFDEAIAALQEQLGRSEWTPTLNPETLTRASANAVLQARQRTLNQIRYSAAKADNLDELLTPAAQQDEIPF
jgi:hypothetical protein